MKHRTWNLSLGRRGRISAVGLLFLLSAVFVAGLLAAALVLRPDARRASHDNSAVRVYCAAGVLQPVEEIVERFNKEYNTRIEIARVGGTGELAGQLKMEFESGVVRGADIYIAADDQLMAQAQADGIVKEVFAFGFQKPVVAVAANRELKIEGLSELVGRDDFSFGITSSRAAIGVLIRDMARRDGLLAALEEKTKAEAENVMNLAQAVVTGSLDAAVLWDATVSQLNRQSDQPVLRVESDLDPQNKYKANIVLGIVSNSEHSSLALKFARYLAAPNAGLNRFEAYGFGTIPGDVWEEVPEIHLYCGSMFTPVMEERVRRFAEREGVNIYPRWEGCGKLVASMRSIRDPELFPDAYLACDNYFLQEVQEYFGPPVTVTTNDIVMAVNKKWADRIKQPQDAIGNDVRIGICDPEQSALGWLTREMFTQSPFAGFYDRLESSAVVTVDVGPTLISQLIAGGVDVAFVYRSNVMADPALLDIITPVEIDDRGANTARAIQPWAISKTTQNPNLMQRLFDLIVSTETCRSFERAGFTVQFPESNNRN